ncbi:putative uncharacterized protein [Roseburia sp. CAG:197]|nr:putative uncharacterized protein [Roseburia sp. CAG:197]
MKKKIVSALLCATMVATMFAGCGSSGDSGDSGDAKKDSSQASGDATVSDSSDDGKVLNIYCWNEEFKSRITDHYPGYEEVDATHGKIGDVEVNWNITPNDDNAYQNNLDTTLLSQADAAADDKIDLFLVEADYALKYVDSDYTMPIKDLGITDDDLSKQYQYTKDIVTDSNGTLKGVSWQGCPGVLFYNREAAKEVLGTDDPDEVQKYVKDWDTFNDTAKKMKDAGYKMTSSVNDSYRVYSNNVSTKWVNDGKITIDDNIMKWVEDSKALYDAKETSSAELWSDDWKKGFYPDGKVFCYFGPAWLVNFSMAADTKGSIGYEDTAKKMKDAGYKMTSSANDTYRVYSNNVTTKWVTDGKVSVDDNIMKWVDDSKKLVDAGETGTFDMWSDDWSKGFYPAGKVFCYFGPAWLVNFSMAADTEGSIGHDGGWGAAQGPQGFFWGGTWICAAKGTDNAGLIKDIMLKMTTDDDIMKDIVVKDDDFVNNKTVMEAMAKDSSYSSKILGGQNPLGMYCAGVESLDLSNICSYDQGCNEEFQKAMKNYFEGKATKEDALDLFYKGVEEKYPELSH